MATTTEQRAAGSAPQVPPLKLSRTFRALPETVFKAWTAAEHVKRWYSPEGSDIPEAEVDPRPGGVFAFRMVFPDGSEHWTRGTFLEVTPSSRLVLDLEAFGADGKSMFKCVTEVGFADAPGGARVEIVQSFRDVDPAVAPMIAEYGAGGWGSTLNRLEPELVRMHGPALPPVRLSRDLAARPATVFRAWTSPEHVARWFAPRPFTVPEAKVERHPGGAFDLLFRGPDGAEHQIRGTFVEVVADRRLVIDMTVEDKAGRAQFMAITEVEITAAAGGSRVDVTQTYTVLDADKAWMVEGAPHGWAAALDQLQEELAGEA